MREKEGPLRRRAARVEGREMVRRDERAGVRLPGWGGVNGCGWAKARGVFLRGKGLGLAAQGDVAVAARIERGLLDGLRLAGTAVIAHATDEAFLAKAEIERHSPAQHAGREEEKEKKS